MKNNGFKLSHGVKTFIEASCTNNIHTGEKFFAAVSFEGLQVLSFQKESKSIVVYFGLYESLVHF